jgi:hypothetical protein
VGRERQRLAVLLAVVIEVAPVALEDRPGHILRPIDRTLLAPADKSDATPKRPAKASLSPCRLERRLKQIEQLNPKSKQQLLNVIDTLIENEALEQRSSL